MSRLYARRDFGQLTLDPQQTTPQALFGEPHVSSGATQLVPVVPQRQCGRLVVSSHHSPGWQQALPQ